MNTTALITKAIGLNPDKGPICPYCQEHSKLVPASVVYKGVLANPFGNIWVCRNYPECDSYVGTHKKGELTDYPLGTLANLELRTARKAVHNVFDLLFKHSHMSRTDAYGWLQNKLNLSSEDCHIAEMDIFKCNLAYVSVLEFFHKTYEDMTNQSTSTDLTWL